MSLAVTKGADIMPTISSINPFGCLAVCQELNTMKATVVWIKKVSELLKENSCVIQQ